MRFPGDLDYEAALITGKAAEAIRELEQAVEDIETGTGVSDHGDLTGLDGDDHLQYLTEGRGDARYSQLGHTHETSTGPQGPMGIPGLDGDDADFIMIPGPQGNPGATGTTGNTGPQGPAGAMGPMGFDGEPGEFIMVPGPQGNQGLTGNTGNTGATGATGPQGPPGLDADESEWFMVPGPQGIQGPQGGTGNTGPQGPQGTPGMPGADGDEGEFYFIPGPQGPAGANGTNGTNGTGGGSGGMIVLFEEADPEPMMIPGPQGATGATGSSGSDPWTYVKLAATFTTSSATAVDVTGMAFTPASSQTYVIEGHFLLRTATATVGPRTGVAWPTAGVTDGVANLYVPSAAATEVMQHGNFNAAVLAPVGGLPTTTQSYGSQMLATLVMTTGAAGTFKVQLASETAGTNVSMQAGSWFRYRTI